MAFSLKQLLARPTAVPLARVQGPGPAARVSKTDAELQVVWGEVYVPDVPDSQGDFMSASTIREMAWGFMQKQALDAIDVQHDQTKSGSYVVESFIARDHDPDFIAGSWVLGVKIPDADVWQLVKSGELNGFSIDGFGIRTLTKLELDIPSFLKGATEPGSDGHVHGFTVNFSDSGAFLGGTTDPAADGHVHAITAGTVTETTNGHNHRFSFIEGMLLANA